MHVKKKDFALSNKRIFNCNVNARCWNWDKELSQLQNHQSNLNLFHPFGFVFISKIVLVLVKKIL